MDEPLNLGEITAFGVNARRTQHVRVPPLRYGLIIEAHSIGTTDKLARV
ncbi:MULTISPECIES: hypothetical protein [unclassified Rhodococcus (in: high G+C Gram-positive bacteria)]|nr:MULTISPECIES: hypothetical protein [unclassified Rhodococcus (in: high G+C Gram-positive bacteria)]